MKTFKSMGCANLGRGSGGVLLSSTGAGAALGTCRGAGSRPRSRTTGRARGKRTSGGVTSFKSTRIHKERIKAGRRQTRLVAITKTASPALAAALVRAISMSLSMGVSVCYSTLLRRLPFLSVFVQECPQIASFSCRQLFREDQVGEERAQRAIAKLFRNGLEPASNQLVAVDGSFEEVSLAGSLP